VAILALALGAVGFAAANLPDAETPITGPALEQASDAAISSLGGGTVTDTEVGDEESYYEVEVTLDDGTQVDVQLDEQFQVIGTEADGADEDG
jgi:uncharacterized membrane protein YkoI